MAGGCDIGGLNPGPVHKNMPPTSALKDPTPPTQCDKKTNSLSFSALKVCLQLANIWYVLGLDFVRFVCLVSVSFFEFVGFFSKFWGISVFIFSIASQPYPFALPCPNSGDTNRFFFLLVLRVFDALSFSPCSVLCCLDWLFSTV